MYNIKLSTLLKNKFMFSELFCDLTRFEYSNEGKSSEIILLRLKFRSQKSRVVTRITGFVVIL